jgi:hypothetical protein
MGAQVSGAPAWALHPARGRGGAWARRFYNARQMEEALARSEFRHRSGRASMSIGAPGSKRCELGFSKPLAEGRATQMLPS